MFFDLAYRKGLSVYQLPSVHKMDEFTKFCFVIARVSDVVSALHWSKPHTVAPMLTSAPAGRV